MPDDYPAIVRRRAGLPALLLSLAACAHRPVTLLDAPPAPPIEVAAAALPPPGPSPINAGLSAAGVVWHLRAGLNVAALSCRGPGEADLAAGYNALLSAQKAALAAAQARLSDEYRAGGGDWQGRFDDQMTRLYNFFANTDARPRLCAAASAVLADAQRLGPGALPGFAAERLPLLDAAIVRPRGTAVASAGAALPARPATPPRLELDLSTLPPG